MSWKKLLMFIIAFVFPVCVGLAAQPPATAPSVATTLPAGWEEIDQRLVFFTVQLASVEASIDAVNKVLRQAGYAQAVKQGKADQFQKNNDMMDRQGGGPVGWKEFYGKTAEQFFFHPEKTIKISIRESQERHAEGELQKNMYTKADRPPQFDYIYKANENAQARADADIAKLGGKIDALADRRRQLETEQASIWAKIAFQAVASRKIGSKPIYRFELKIDGTDDETKQRQSAARAGAAFVRTVLAAIGTAQDSLSSDPSATFDALNQQVAGASRQLSDTLVHSPKLAMDVSDANTPVGRLVASAERMADVSRNIAESYRSAIDGDKAGDDQRKQTFRAFVQQALFDCATNITATSEYMVAISREWKAEIDVAQPLAEAAVSGSYSPSTANGAAFLSDIPVLQATGFSYGLKGLCAPIGVLIVKGVRTPNGIGMHPENHGTSTMTFDLAERFKHFDSTVALNDTAPTSAAPIWFKIVADGRIIWTSEPVQKSSDAQKVSLDVQKVKTLELRVELAGDYKNAHAVWVEPTLTGEALAPFGFPGNALITSVPDSDKPLVEDGWTIVFRSQDPLLWNIAVRNKDSYSVPTSAAPKFKYIRMRRMDTKEQAIIAATDFGTKALPANHSYLRSDKRINKNACCLGIVDMSKPADFHQVPLLDMTSIGNFAGYGFGCWETGGERQGYLWNGQSVDPVVMEIAVTDQALSDAEQKSLLKK